MLKMGLASSLSKICCLKCIVLQKGHFQLTMLFANPNPPGSLSMHLMVKNTLLFLSCNFSFLSSMLY